MILKDVNVFGQALIFMSKDLPYIITYWMVQFTIATTVLENGKFCL